jgi:hypothetical protein
MTQSFCCDAIFGLSPRARNAVSLRQQLLDLFGALDPVPPVSFSGQIEGWIADDAQQSLIALLREAVTVVAADGVVSDVRVEQSTGVLTIACAVRGAASALDEHVADLRERAEAHGAGFDAVPGADGMQLSWRVTANVADPAGA